MAFKQRDYDLARSMAAESVTGYRGGGSSQSAQHARSSRDWRGPIRRSPGAPRRVRGDRERLDDGVGLQTGTPDLGVLRSTRVISSKPRLSWRRSSRSRGDTGSRWRLRDPVSAISASRCIGQGGIAEARPGSTESLDASVRHGSPEEIAYCLVGLGAVAAEAGRSDRSARLLGGRAVRIADEAHMGFEVYGLAAGRRQTIKCARARSERLLGPPGGRRALSAGGGTGARGLHRLIAMTAAGDLRDWIALLEREGELVRVAAEVDPHLEITEITDRVVKSRRARAPVRAAEGLRAPAADQPVRHRAAHVPRVRRRDARRRRRRSSATCSRCSRRRASPRRCAA